MSGSTQKLGPLESPPVDYFFEMSPPLLEQMLELEAVGRLLGSDFYVVVDNRLAMPAETARGEDPGGFPV